MNKQTTRLLIRLNKLQIFFIKFCRYYRIREPINLHFLRLLLADAERLK